MNKLIRPGLRPLNLSLLRLSPLALAALFILGAGSASAQTTYIRQNNTTLLNVAGAWSPTGGPPGAGDTAKWDNTDSGNLSTALGGSVTWGQIAFSNNLGGNVIIANTAGANLTLNGINGIGIDMTMANRNLTLSDPVILGSSQMWSVGLDFAQTASPRVLAVGYPIGEASAGLALTKVGLYQLTLNPATPNTFTGGLKVNAGTVLADFSNMGTTTDLINNGNPLTLGGGTLIIQGKASSTTAQTFNGLTVNQGYSYLTNNLNTATSVTTTLGGITRNTGGTLSFGSTGTFNTSQGNVNGILGPWAFVGLAGSTKYAVGGGNIAGLTGTSASTAAAVTDTTGTPNYDVAAGVTLGAGANFNTLRYTGAAGTIAGAFTANGLMNAAASAALTLSGAATIGSTRELVVNPAGTGGITLSGVIGDNGGGASALTLGGGTATVTLSATNTFSGPVTVGAGTLAINNIANGGSPSALGQSSASATNLVLGNGATLAYNGTAVGTSDRSFTLNGSASLNGNATAALLLTNTAPIAFGVTNQSLTLTLGGGNNLSVTNILAAQITDNGAGEVQIGHGASGNVWWLTNPNNSFSGGLRFSRGFLMFSSGALGTKGTIGFDANSVYPFGLRWAPGCSDDISSRFNGVTSANGGYGILDVGTNDVVFAYGISPGKNPSWITKDGTGSLTMNATNVWGSAANGATTINAGTLVVKSLNNGGVNDGIGGVVNGAQWFGFRDGATFKYVGAGSTNDHNFHFNGNAAIDASGTGPLVFSQTGAISPTPAARAYTIASGQKTTGNAPSTPSDLPIGMTVGGTGVAVGSKIVSIGINGQLTLDQNTTAAVSSLTFGSYLTGTLTLTGTNTGNNEVKGIIQDSVSGIDASVAVRSLAKTGTGKWILSGANTYSGTTTIGGGTLLVNGSLSPASAVTVSGGALGGTGAINGPLTINAGGTVSLGSSGAILTLGSATAPTFAASSTLKIAAATNTLDKLSLTNAASTFDCGSLSLVVDTTGLANTFSNVEIVHTANASGILNNFANITVIGDTSYYAIVSYAGNSITLSLTKSLATAGAYQIQVAGSSSATANAGDNVALTITALNLAGSPLTSLNGDVALSFFGLNASLSNNAPVITDKNGVAQPVTATLGTTNTVLTFVNGVATVSGANNGLLTAYKAGTATLNCSDGVASSTSGTGASGLSLTINPLAIAGYTVAAASPQTTGVSFLTTVNAVDIYGNTVTSDNSTVVTMTSSGSAQFDSNGDTTFGDNTKTLVNGSFTISTLDNVAESLTLTASSSGGQTGTSSVIVVNPNSAKDILSFTFPNYGPATISGTNITITVPFGSQVTNLAPTYTMSGVNGSPASGTALDFTSPQIYTITAADSSTKAYLVTVTVAPHPTIFTWANTVSGIWSVAASWTNNLADGTGPAVTGYSDYSLNFNQAGTYSATNDFNDGFLLNQLNFGGATVALMGNGLAFTNNGTTLPQINQNSTANVTVSNNVVLATNLIVNLNGSGKVYLPMLISGQGSVTINGPGTLNLWGQFAPNTYPGGTIINSGTLVWGTVYNGTSYDNSGACGTGPVTLNSGGTISFNKAYPTNAFILNGGTLYTANGWGFSLRGPITVNSNTPLNAAGGQITLSGPISGAGGFTKTGGNVNFTGSNSFTGGLVLNAGTLTFGSFNSVSGGKATSNLGAPTNAAGGTISLGSPATLVYTGPGETTDRILQLAGTTGGATLTQQGTAAGLPVTQTGQSGFLKFTSDLSIPGVAGQDNRKTLTLTSAETSTTSGFIVGQGEISGSIGDSVQGNSGQKATSVTKSGYGTWTLSGSNSYSGTTTIQVGKLVCAGANALGTGPLVVTDSDVASKLELDFVGLRSVASLTINGVVQPNGIYGSSSSLATTQDDVHFAGPGAVVVGSLATATTNTLALTSGANPSSVGTSLTFTATVTGSNSPSGSVVFYDGLTPLGTNGLDGSAQASFSTSLLLAGAHPITALYLGNSSNAPSASATLTQTVTDSRPATTVALALTAGSNPSSFGAPVTYTATVTGATPTGTVNFYNGTSLIGSSVLNGSAQASLTVNNLPSGWDGIWVSYLGDAKNGSSTNSPTWQRVTPPAGNGKLKVFLLAGQSNMQGKGYVETGRDPNNPYGASIVGGLGSLRNMLNKNPNQYGYLVDTNTLTDTTVPGWRTLTNVWVSYFTTSTTTPSTTESRKGYLDADYGNNSHNGMIGPEYGFGLTVGSQLGDPVLIIKNAWGGTSLTGDWRPPSSGGTVGPCYATMLSNISNILANLSTELTNFNYNVANGYEIVGFGWHQGWNDIGEPEMQYETNLVNFIHDVRAAVGVPNLPFVIGITGMGSASGNQLNICAAQAAVANPVLHPELAGTVFTVDTRPFDYGLLLGVSSQNYHWYQNAESYFHIGQTLGQGMLQLLANKAGVTNTPASSVTTNSAALNAAVTWPFTPVTVVVYWDTVDHGTNAGAWPNSAVVNSWNNSIATNQYGLAGDYILAGGPILTVATNNLSFNATGLAANTTYYYTYAATNQTVSDLSLTNGQVVWAPSSQSFSTTAAQPSEPPTPVLPGSGVTISNGVPSFSFLAAAGAKYRLDYKNALTDGWSYGPWTTNTSANAQQMLLSDPSAVGQPQRFYRLEAAWP